jgi:hypothetical protein
MIEHLSKETTILFFEYHNKGTIKEKTAWWKYTNNLSSNLAHISTKKLLKKIPCKSWFLKATS